MKRLFTILLCGMFLCVGVFVSSTGESYAEEEHWAEQYLNNLVAQGIMRGDDEGNLNPDNAITRAEFVAMMNRTFGYSEKGKMSFNDVPAEAWYYDDISIAKNQGYFNGIYPDTAGPEEYLKREEAVTMLCRALKIEGQDSDTLQFSDSRAFSAWSKAYINASVEKNFLTGYPDQTFRPTDYMRRGEMAKVLSDVAGEIVKEEGSNYIGYANGNVSVVQTGASLRNTIVPGDLYITAGMGTGYTQLENLVVGGDLIISGTGNAESGQVSVILTDCDINHLIIDSGSAEVMSVRAEGGSVIESTTIKSTAYLEEDNSKGIAFKDVTLKGPSGTSLSLSGNFENVVVKAEGNKLSLDKGNIDSLTVDEDAVKGSVFLQKDTVVSVLYCDTATTVTGTGTVDEISINANGCNISMLPDHIYIRPGVTAVVNGQTMNSLDAEANNADPEFIEDYPKYQDLATNSVTLLVKTNKPGKVYWAVKNIDVVNSGMSEEEVLNPDKRYVVKSGNVSVVGEKEITIKVSGLTSGVNYEYYMVFEDFKEQRTDVEGEAFKTVDNIVPKFLNSTPKVQSSTKDSFTMVVMPSKNVTLYWAILPNKAVPPTIESLSELKVSGALGKGEISGCAMNDPREILMTGTDGKLLAESVTYDIYMVMRDESDNLSRLAKVVATTLDETPPEFMEGYPWAEPSAATSLKIRNMSNETGTLFWAAYDFDADFPPVEDFDAITDAAIKKELQIRAITTGQKAVKNGKMNITKDKDSLLTISGMAQRTPFDVYMLLMDKAGNYSEVASLKGLKTLDKQAPVAAMEFDKVLDGNPMINSKISVAFDEIVYYDGAEKDIRLTELTAEQKAGVLESMFSVHDLISVTKPDYITGINFDKVEITEKSGKTIVTFGQECFGNGKGLNSGGYYQFELSNVIDADGNAMGQATLLEPFKVVPPQIYLSRYNGEDILADNELGFSVQTTGEVNSDKSFDAYIRTNKLINFDLTVYGKTTDAEGNETRTGIASAQNIRLEPGMARSVASLNPSQGYQKFVDVTDMDYKIHINAFEGIEETRISSWDGEIQIEAMAAIGEPADLTNLGTSIMNSTDPFTIITNNEDTLVVSNPTVFSVKRAYADSAQPQLVDSIEYDTFDTAVNVILMTDKAARIYYVTVPLANVAGKETPTTDQIMAGLPQYLGSKTGIIELPEGNIQVEELIQDLEPDTEYKFFYVIRGKAPDNLEVGNPDTSVADFKTEEPIVPRLLTVGADRQDGQLQPSGISDDVSVEMKGAANTDAKLYWIMRPAGLTDSTVVPDGGIELGGTVDSPYTPEQLISISDTDSTLADWGVMEVSRNEEFKFTAENMDSTKTYDIFATLVSNYSDTRADYVYIYRNVRSKDVIPPSIVNARTSITDHNVTDSGIISSGEAIQVIAYDGSVSVTFSEPLYYKNSLSGSNLRALTEAKIVTDGGIITDTSDGGLVVFDRRNVNLTADVVVTDDADANGDYAVTGINFYFENVKRNSNISISGYIYDRGGRLAGQFEMTFVEDKTDPFDSYFDVRFVGGE